MALIESLPLAPEAWKVGQLCRLRDERNPRSLFDVWLIHELHDTREGKLAVLCRVSDNYEARVRQELMNYMTVEPVLLGAVRGGDMGATHLVPCPAASVPLAVPPLSRPAPLPQHLQLAPRQQPRNSQQVYSSKLRFRSLVGDLSAELYFNQWFQLPCPGNCEIGLIQKPPEKRPWVVNPELAEKNMSVVYRSALCPGVVWILELWDTLDVCPWGAWWPYCQSCKSFYWGTLYYNSHMLSKSHKKLYDNFATYGSAACQLTLPCGP